MPTIVETVMFPAIVEGVKELSDTANDTYFKIGIKIPNIDYEYFKYFTSFYFLSLGK
jgi:hypothetical protein